MRTIGEALLERIRAEHAGHHAVEAMVRGHDCERASVDTRRSRLDGRRRYMHAMLVRDAAVYSDRCRTRAYREMVRARAMTWAAASDAIEAGALRPRGIDLSRVPPAPAEEDIPW